MKSIFFVLLISTILVGCGKKSAPEYQGIKIERKTVVNL
tara:strand:+ start:361 stop:477 length:117 start_codon:yes stop_codon:yes gene_type:complete